MFDDLFNASFLTLIVAIGAAAFDTDAASTLPTTLIAQTHVVALPTVVVIERRAPLGRDLALTSAD